MVYRTETGVPTLCKITKPHICKYTLKNGPKQPTDSLQELIIWYKLIRVMDKSHILTFLGTYMYKNNPRNKRESS